MSEIANKDIFKSLVRYFRSVLLSLVFIGCAHPKDSGLKEYYEVRPYFGTVVSIHCFYGPEIDIAKVVRQCWLKADQIHLNMNVYADSPEGDLGRLNAGGFSGVRVHEDVYRVLKHSIEYSQLMRGAYDVTIFPLVELWKNAERQGRLPDQTALESARDKVGYSYLRLQEPDTVFFLKKGMKVDLGSPASGYFCDEMAKILDAHGIQHFLVDGGGELFARGENNGVKRWRIGIQDPFHKDKILSVIEIKDQGVSTSGNYEKFYMIGAQKFSHIINPATGYPEKNAVSVTVIADTAEAANELSTGLCVLGREKGLKLIRTLKNVQALIIEQKNGDIITDTTENFPTAPDSLL